MIPARRVHLWAALLAGAVGLLWFLTRFHLAALDVTNIGWVMHGDWSANELGWLMFRRAPWRFPAGSIPGLLYPIGSFIGVTDSTPLIALLLRPFSSVLPTAFQFIGPWIAVCFTLQGVCGALLTSAFTEDARLQALGGMLFALSPVLDFRTNHASLCGQWLLLLALWLALAPLESSVRRRISAISALVALSALVHPYLWAMMVPLAFALLVRLWLERRARTATLVLSAAGMVVLGLAGFYGLGLIGHGLDAREGGFGFFSADLLALLNPMGHSRLLPDLPHGPGQYEGFAFLGLGLIFLVGLALVRAWRHRTALDRGVLRRWGPALAVCVLMAMFALSSVVTIAGHTVATARHLYQPLAHVTGPLRSSGRFIWPLHYLIVAMALALVFGWLRGRANLVLAVIVAVVAVQAIDTLRSPAWTAPTDRWNPLRSSRWDALAKGRTHVVLYPVQLQQGGCPYPEAQLPDLYSSATWLAYRHDMTINSGYVARTNSAKMVAYCQGLIANGQPTVAQDTLYLVAEGWQGRFAGRPDVQCERIDGVLACVSSTGPIQASTR